MSRLPQVCWLLSPIRSGSSVTVYAAGAGLGWPVADEVFGPWDRTGEPYHYPASHVRLLEAFQATGETLTGEIATLAAGVFGDIAEQADAPGVLCKHPHASIGPEHIAAHWPGHHSVVLLRNPLYALNSLFVRGWDEATGGGSMIGYFSTIGQRWLADPHRLVYEDLQQDAAGFFTRLYQAWGLEPTAERVERAVAYKAGHYHHSSRSQAGAEPGDRPMRVRSARSWAVPEPIVAEYLADPLMREVFARAGWAIERGAYPGVVVR